MFDTLGGEAMDAKELREAAEHCLATSEGRYDGTSIGACLMARYILATMPDDDAEPVTEEWLETMASMALSKRYCLTIGPVWACPPCGNLDWHWSISDGRFLLPIPKTRGDVRRLISALGVEVPKPCP